jgi:hypothetical protein
MAIRPHSFENMGAGLIQIEENIAGIASSSVGQQIDVETLIIARSQKAHHRGTPQLSGCPQPFSWSGSVCRAVNQTEEVEIVRHTRQLAADSLQGEEKSAVRHKGENGLKAPCLKINFQRVVNSVLTYCLSSGDNPMSLPANVWEPMNCSLTQRSTRARKPLKAGLP